MSKMIVLPSRWDIWEVPDEIMTILGGRATEQPPEIVIKALAAQGAARLGEAPIKVNKKPKEVKLGGKEKPWFKQPPPQGE